MDDVLNNLLIRKIEPKDAAEITAIHSSITMDPPMAWKMGT